MQNNIKAMRFEITNPINMEWDVFRKILFDLRYNTRFFMNKAIQYCWEYEGFSSDYKKEYDTYPNSKTVLKTNFIHNYIYNSMLGKLKKLGESNILNTGNLDFIILPLVTSCLYCIIKGSQKVYIDNLQILGLRLVYHYNIYMSVSCK